LDGKLSWDEFRGEETKNEKAFKLMDVDNNGKVSKNVNSCQFMTHE
jgi:Ca2+-binding EF-hand superfamily protein